MQTFKRGVHPDDRKSLTENSVIEVMPAPKTVYIPLQQHLGAEALPIVEIGDYVKIGQLIGSCAADKLSANVFSSVSGTVKEIKAINLAGGTRCNHVVVENDFKEEKVFLEKIEKPQPEQIRQRLKDAGIVGMGGASFPADIKYCVSNKKIDTLIINGAECEPYITCDYRIMLEYTDKLVKGIFMLARALGVDNVIIGIEDNKKAAIEALQGYQNLKVVSLKSKYPQGAEKQLVYAATKRVVPALCLPYEVGCVVSNVHSAYSTYLAVAEGIPSYERVVTVSGEATKRTGNFIVRTGTTIESLLDFVGGYKNPAQKIVAGGPMMGYAIFKLDTAVTKATSSILFLTENEINTDMASQCINCGRCAKVCPYFLMPMFIDSRTLIRDFASAKKYGAMHCIECGCCAYVCPTKRPLVQSIRLAKKMIKRYEV